MISRLLTAAVNPSNDSSTPSLPKSSAKTPISDSSRSNQDCNCTQELLRLQIENLQLRRELQGANQRIQELELINSQALPSNCFASADDDSSVEVQSLDVISASSSTTTIPTGSALSNEYRAHLQQRDDKDSKRNQRRRRQQRGSSKRFASGKYSRALRGGPPSKLLATILSKSDSENEADDDSLDRLFLSCASSVFSEISESSDSLMVAPNHHQGQRSSTLLHPLYQSVNGSNSKLPINMYPAAGYSLKGLHASPEGEEEREEDSEYDAAKRQGGVEV